jgi:hypothetical protein
LSASPDRVIATLSKRLKSRKVPFVCADQRPNLASDDDECIVRLKQTFHWKDQVSPDHLGVIFGTVENGAVFMTTTVALAVYAAPNSRTWVDTLARYDLLALQDAELCLPSQLAVPKKVRLAECCEEGASRLQPTSARY